jgi:hypothetical protein
MGIIDKFINKQKTRVGNTLDGLRPPKTKGAHNISTVEGIYVILVFAILFIFLGMVKGDGLGAIIMIGTGIFALSKNVKSIAIPRLYDVCAKWFTWPSFKEALRGEDEARARDENDSQTSKPSAQKQKQSTSEANSGAKADNNEVRRALGMYAALSNEDKIKSADDMIKYLLDNGISKSYFIVYLNETARGLRQRLALSSLDAYISHTDGHNQ